MTHDEVRALILSFPETEGGVTHGEPSFKVAGKFFTWLRPRLDDSVVVHLDSLDERELLIEMDPATFHFTAHYRDHPIVLARLISVDPQWLEAMLRRRWIKIAPKRLAREWQANQSG
ncbi:MAG: MmcQ/YjbR family DNA-binding protein [Brevundimonas sp.]|uniref:MmcQ/YjbR family DNA-binding protein n=1 Tax=Brevundimonas sp. TaxID=1871086 RepID=UPI001206F657|nr:MmcQ/YjbR family DNA-binding protein [Brevundimonas sp.]RZJ19004.1 MAG: MmcQ/YjbR family DNA-binding protein [Brevundimonas sp.]